MRIGIDVRYLSHGLFGGVHTYVANLVPTLVRHASEHEVFLYADTKRPLELNELPENAQVRYLPYRNALSSIAIDLFMRRHMERDALDLVHFPANYGFGPSSARSVITLHDAINVLPLYRILRGHRKQPKTIAMMTYLHLMTTAAVRQADLIITTSEYSRREISRHTRLPDDRILAVYHGRAQDLERIEDQSTLSALRQRLHIERPFVLADALKNPGVLVRAWQLLPSDLRERHQLVFFSRRADPLPIVHEAVSMEGARLLVRPSRKDLLGLFSMAEAFVFPSWIEGFGLPVLEAMACGAPVIGSDRGSIPEVAGGAALLADAESAEAFAGHLQRVLRDPAEGRRLRGMGFERAAQFSWDRCAQQVVGGYQRLLGEETRGPEHEGSLPTRKTATAGSGPGAS